MFVSILHKNYSTFVEEKFVDVDFCQYTLHSDFLCPATVLKHFTLTTFDDLPRLIIALPAPLPEPAFLNLTRPCRENRLFYLFLTKTTDFSTRRSNLISVTSATKHNNGNIHARRRISYTVRRTLIVRRSQCSFATTLSNRYPSNRKAGATVDLPGPHKRSC